MAFDKKTVALFRYNSFTRIHSHYSGMGLQFALLNAGQALYRNFNDSSLRNPAQGFIILHPLTGGFPGIQPFLAISRR